MTPPDWFVILVAIATLGGFLYLVELVGRLLLIAFRAIQDRRTPRAWRTADAPR